VRTTVIVTDQFDENLLLAILKPVFHFQARCEARRWIAAHLQPARTKCSRSSSSWKGAFERDFPQHYITQSAFERVLIEAGLMRGDELFAKVIKEAK
jgi:hypothetical protein